MSTFRMWEVFEKVENGERKNDREELRSALKAFAT